MDEFKEIFCYYDYVNVNDKSEKIIIDLREVIKARNLNLETFFR